MDKQTLTERATKDPHYRLTSAEQARGVCEELVAALPEARSRIEWGTPAQARRASWGFMQQVGAAQATVVAMHRMGFIPDAMADELYAKCLASMLSKTTDFKLPILKR